MEAKPPLHTNYPEYDQILYFPEQTEARLRAMGVFDYDDVIFRTLWEKLDEDPKRFAAYLRYYLSDHRPLWCQVSIEPA